MIGSYPTVFQIGHRAIGDLFNGEVVVEEKVDGSQISFGVVDGELCIRSKGIQLIIGSSSGMFQKAVDTILSIQDKLTPGWIYRGEFLGKPKHNTLAYERVPKGNIIGYDIMTGVEEYLTPTQKHISFNELGLEVVPCFYTGVITDKSMLLEYLAKNSILGGVKIEGVVVKNYNVFTMEKKIALGKYVSTEFQEVHQGEWRKSNPTSKDIELQIINEYKTTARWEKALQHLRDNGQLTETSRDIGSLINEVKTDVKKECESEIKDKLFKHFWPHIERGITSGVPEWYKDVLFNKDGEK
jgi:hypothetical protein